MFRDDYPSYRCKDKGTVQAFDAVRPVYHHEGHYRRYEPEAVPQIEGFNRENLSLTFSPPAQRRTVSLYKETTPYE